MSLSARSIAMQGLGFGPRHVALQGLVPFAAVSAGGRRVRVPRALVDAQRAREIDEDDTMMLIACALAVGGTGMLQ